MQFLKLYCFLLFFFVTGCAEQSQDRANIYSTSGSIFSPKYAKGFAVSEVSSGFVVEIYNPWQGANDVKFRYGIFSAVDSASFSGDFDEAISLPLKRIICLSTTHTAYIDLLGESDRIVGVSGVNFVSSPNVQKNIQRGIVKDVGYEQLINYEIILGLKPDIVFSYGVGAEAAGYLHKLKELRIPVVYVGDYLEENPLGKAEWIKFFGLLLGKYKTADELFAPVEMQYNVTKELVKDVQKKPKVFINLPWNDVWYFPGNNSYMATLIKDAGGNYLFQELNGNQSYPFNIESAMVKGMEADVWINTGSLCSKSEISGALERFSIFPALKSGNVFNNNGRMNEKGGNDFWESGVVNPHIILKDLVKIFHPDSIQHELVYYRKLE